MTDDWPAIRRIPPPLANPREIPFAPHLDVPPLTPPQRTDRRRDLIYERRVEADRLCLWMACGRVLCRSSRHCVGTHAACVFENPAPSIRFSGPTGR